MSGGKGGSSRQATQQVNLPAFLEPFARQQAQVGTSALGSLQSPLSGAGAAELVAPLNADQQSALDRAPALATDPNGGAGMAQKGLTLLAQTGPGEGVGGAPCMGTSWWALQTGEKTRV